MKSSFWISICSFAYSLHIALNSGWLNSLLFFPSFFSTSTPEYSFTEEKTLYHSGFRYEGEYQNDIPEGFGRLYDAEGRLRYKGQWKAGDPHGFGTSFYENGSIKFQGEWSKGVSVFK